jgi:hypothetical protein
MSSTKQEITALKVKIERLEEEREKEANSEDRKELLALITAKEVRLHDLNIQLQHERQQQQQGKIICKIPIQACSFNIYILFSLNASRRHCVGQLRGNWTMKGKVIYSRSRLIININHAIYLFVYAITI